MNVASVGMAHKRSSTLILPEISRQDRLKGAAAIAALLAEPVEGGGLGLGQERTSKPVYRCPVSDAYTVDDTCCDYPNPRAWGCVLCGASATAPVGKLPPEGPHEKGPQGFDPICSGAFLPLRLGTDDYIRPSPEEMLQITLVFPDVSNA
jgi:hypothetical protein